MRIGIDIDGVVYPWHYSMYRYFTEFKGYTGTQVQFWKDFSIIPNDTQNYYVSLPFLYSNTVPSKCVFEGLEMLATLGELFYITARGPDDVKTVTRKFLKNYNLPFSENLIFEKDKATVCRMLGIEYFIDDQIKHLIPMQGFVKTYLMSAPHNIDNRDGFTVVNSLKEFYNEITRSN